MLFRQTLMSQFAIRNFPSTRRSRRSGPWPIAIETLEVRKYLSATMTVVNDGRTLHVVGDSSDNSIEIVQDERGVHIAVDQMLALNFTGIESIVVQTGYGNDDVRVIYGFNPQPDPPGDQLRALNLRVSLGSGNDSFSADLEAGTQSILMGIDAGIGNDVVTMRTVVDPNDRPESVVDPNVYNMKLYANLGNGDDTFQGNLLFTSDPCHLVVMGGGGADNINALIGLLSKATPEGDASGALDMLFDGGSGNDQFNLKLDLASGDLNPPSENDPASLLVQPVRLAVLGGDGNDQLSLSVRNLAQLDSLFETRLDGGAGLDTSVLMPDLDASGWTK